MFWAENNNSANRVLHELVERSLVVAITERIGRERAVKTVGAIDVFDRKVCVWQVLD